MLPNYPVSTGRAATRFHVNEWPRPGVQNEAGTRRVSCPNRTRKPQRVEPLSTLRCPTAGTDSDADPLRRPA